MTRIPLISFRGFLITALLVSASAAPAPSQAHQGKTYWVSTSGNDGNDGSEKSPFRTIQSGSDRLGRGDTLVVKAGVYKEYVQLHRSGSYLGDRITIRAADGEQVIIDPGDSAPPRPSGNWSNAVLDTNAQDHINLIGLTVRGGKSCGIAVNGSWQIDLKNCRSENAHLSGIIVDKSEIIRIDACDIARACTEGEESVSIKRSSDVTFDHCHVHDTGHEGIDVKEGSKHVRVTDCEIDHVERQGLYADAWDSSEFDIHFESNLVHDCQFGMDADSETGGQLSDVWFVNNVVYNCKGPGMIVPDWGAKDRPHPVKDVYFIYNTVVNCGKPDGWGGGMVFESTFAENIVVANNILSQNRVGQLHVTDNKRPKSMKIMNNLIDGVSDDIGENNIQGKPLFRDPEHGDFRLKPGSPGIDAGTHVPPVDQVRIDFDRHRRAMGAAPDAGAFESN